MSEFSEVPSVVRQGELVREIGQELVSGLPGGWVKAVHDRKQLVSYGEDLCFLTDEHGQVSREWAPRPVEKLVDELRAVMYKSGVGTWWRDIGMHLAEGGLVEAFFEIWPKYDACKGRNWMNRVKGEIVSGVARHHGWRDAIELCKYKRVGDRRGATFRELAHEDKGLRQCLTNQTPP